LVLALCRFSAVEMGSACRKYRRTLLVVSLKNHTAHAPFGVWGITGAAGNHVDVAMPMPVAAVNDAVS